MTDLFAYIDAMPAEQFLICAMLALIVILMLDRRW
jgi:hypothetical protein